MQDHGARPSQTSLPRMLGRYALYEKIASGGMASVHIGRLLGPVGFARTVAIKRMHAQFAEDPEFVSMFLDEARLAARIRHPNVVPTLDVVATEGELFLVMDFVQGESLSRLLTSSIARTHTLPLEMVASLVVGILHGLHAAHEAKSDRGEPLGIVHRDVSPHNVLVGTDGVARLIDFGVAKAVGRIQTTREGQLKGKLAYMAPEQIRGKVTRASDVYAASIVLWEALTGTRLFSADNEGALLDRVMRGCDLPPSNYLHGLPRIVDDITMRGLSLDPTKRFATAREMARALEDAVRLAPPSRIGDWVEAAAKQTLEARSRRIAAIEGDSSMASIPLEAVGQLVRPTDGRGFTPSQPVDSRQSWSPPALPPGQAPGDIPVHERAAPVSVIDDLLLASGSASSPNKSIPPPRARTTSIMITVSVAAVLLASALVGVALSRSTDQTLPERAAATGGPLPSSSPAPPEPAVATPTAPNPPTASAVAPTVAAPAPLPAPVPTPLPVPASAEPAKATPPPARPASHCNPPWTKDARGVQIFKKECL